MNMAQQTMQAGDHHLLGAHCDGKGVNFALFSAHAERVELCLFDSTGHKEVGRYDLPSRTHDVWHGYFPKLSAGTVYGYRVHGPFEPHAGHRFNPNKLLLDPYARKLCGAFVWHDAHFAYCYGSDEEDLSFDSRDNSAYMTKGVVLADNPPEKTSKPNIPWHKTSIYEAHTKGLTICHPNIPAEFKGRFSGLADRHIISHLKVLGVNTVELLPVQAFIDEHFLARKGLSNYWGYNTLSYFAPHPGYLSGNDPAEFRHTVNALHDAGIEVILDVVYNHTCESNRLGPTLSFRGIDNASYYRLQADQARYYVNDTGCGNTLDVSQPRVLQLIMDSLRYWAVTMDVDGFRFDLAPILGRNSQGFSAQAAFFQSVAQDPILSRLKLIAEPWDIGPGGYQLGQFPPGWSEWNDDYRDSVRRFWRQEPDQLPVFARRLHGSSDRFEANGRKPSASINYISSHDGFSLTDLVSYKHRHNLANGEQNRDDHRENLSNNFGVEGPSPDPAINEARRRQRRNLLATLYVSQGVPMLQAGDELGRTQRGNNNAYCQDNELSWIDWSTLGEEAGHLIEFISRLQKIRNDYPVLGHPEYIHSPDRNTGVQIDWLHPSGESMSDAQWHQPDQFSFGYLLCSTSTISASYSILVLFNGGAQPEEFSLPNSTPALTWNLLLDTTRENGDPERVSIDHSERVFLKERSVIILATQRGSLPHRETQF